MDFTCQQWRFIKYCALSFILVRLASLGLYPLYDTTEARYSEMARIMVETQNYLTPMFDYATPFWGKPPLHTWATALSFEVFGISEFSARLPHFMATLFTIILIYCFANKVMNRQKAWITLLVLSSILGFIIGGAMVMTDAILTLSITLAMTSFWGLYTHKIKAAGLVFFAALAIGMLVKGPVAIVIVGIALTTWSLYNRCLFNALKALPWLTGTSLFLLLTIPWYLMAEFATPGFLNYFLWGEHVLRFIEPGWQGDLYGTAHDETKGMIWLFWLGVAFPWSFILVSQLVKKRRLSSTKSVTSNSSLKSYLVAWTISPMLLFTLAGNILPAYVLPGLPAFAMLIAQYNYGFRTLFITSTASLMLLIVSLTYIVSGNWNKDSQMILLDTLEPNIDIYYWKKRPFSGQFYSQGKAKLLSEPDALSQLILQDKPYYLLARHKDLTALSSTLRQCIYQKSSPKYSLMQCNWPY